MRIAPHLFHLVSLSLSCRLTCSDNKDVCLLLLAEAVHDQNTDDYHCQNEAWTKNIRNWWEGSLTWSTWRRNARQLPFRRIKVAGGAHLLLSVSVWLESILTRTWLIAVIKSRHVLREADHTGENLAIVTAGLWCLIHLEIVRWVLISALETTLIRTLIYLEARVCLSRTELSGNNALTDNRRVHLADWESLYCPTRLLRNRRLLIEALIHPIWHGYRLTAHVRRHDLLSLLVLTGCLRNEPNSVRVQACWSVIVDELISWVLRKQKVTLGQISLLTSDFLGVLTQSHSLSIDIDRFINCAGKTVLAVWRKDTLDEQHLACCVVPEKAIITIWGIAIFRVCYHLIVKIIAQITFIAAICAVKVAWTLTLKLSLGRCRCERNAFLAVLLEVCGDEDFVSFSGREVVVTWSLAIQDIAFAKASGSLS